MGEPLQARRLRAAGASPAEVDELLRYDEQRFPAPDAALAGVTPLPDEPHVGCWRAWAEQAAERGAYPVLRDRLPQLAFPVREGISASDDYRAATLLGTPPAALDAATGLDLERPEALELHLYPSFAGTVPILVARHRPDFVRLVQALAKRNEPVPVAAAQGAAAVGGYNNWARIRALREAWEARHPAERETATWAEEFARLKPDKPLYQDRFILLSDGPYSAVPAADLGLDEAPWRRLSLEIRKAHECAHIYTRRVYGLMRDHLVDELIADYAGLTVATGRFRAAWLLRFLGLEDPPRYRRGGRLDIYRGTSPLSEGAFRVLRHLVHAAALNLEVWSETVRPDEPARAIRAMAALGLLDLAAEDGAERLRRTGG